MGADIADINNDGYPDLFTTDMFPMGDHRLKTMGAFDKHRPLQCQTPGRLLLSVSGQFPAAEQRQRLFAT